MNDIISKVWNREFLIAIVGVGAILFGWSDVAQSEIVSSVAMGAGTIATLYAKVRG